MRQLSAAWRSMSEQEKDRYRAAAAKQTAGAARARSRSTGGGSRQRRSHSVSLCRFNEKAVLSQGNRAMPQLLFGLKFADNIHYKFKSSKASKARLQSSKCTGAKQNLTQNGHSRSFKVTCFGVSGKAIRD